MKTSNGLFGFSFRFPFAIAAFAVAVAACRPSAIGSARWIVGCLADNLANLCLSACFTILLFSLFFVAFVFQLWYFLFSILFSLFLELFKLCRGRRPSNGSQGKQNTRTSTQAWTRTRTRTRTIVKRERHDMPKSKVGNININCGRFAQKRWQKEMNSNKLYVS